MNDVKTALDRDKVLSELNRVVQSAVADIVEERFKNFEERVAAKSTSHGEDLATGTFDVSTKGDDRIRVSKRTAGRVLLAVAAARYSKNIDGATPMSAAQVAEKNWPGDLAVEKSLTSGQLESGGALVEGGYRDEFIDLLVPRVAVRKLGPVLTPMPEGSLTVPRTEADTTAYYVGESQAVNKSEPKTGSIKLSAKKLATLVPISNSLIRRAAAGRSSVNVEAYVQRLAVRRQSLREDLAFIRGAGTEHSPKGLRNLALAANLIPANATVNFINVLADLGKLISTLEGADVPMVNPKWIMAPRVKNYLAFQALSDDRPFFLQMIQAGELLGFEFATSSQVPTNLGGGTESEILLQDMDQVLLGETLDLMVTSSGEASYREGGTMVSAYERDETVLRLISEHDLGVEHSEAIAALTEVTWGA